MHTGHEAFSCKQRLVRADDDGVPLRQDLHDINFAVRRHPQAPALADGIVDNAAVGADNIAVQVEERAGFWRFAGAALDDLRVIAVRDKADVLAVVLAGVDQAGFGGNFTRFGLTQAAKRELDPRKRLLCQIVEHVALVLRLVEGLFEDVLLPFPLDAGIVPGGDIAAAHDIGALKQLVEFQIAVAVDAGVRRNAVLIGVHKAVDDALGEFVLEVEDIIRHTEAVGHTACVLDIVERTAGVGLRNARVFIIIELHRAADAGEACVRQQLGRDGGIHAAGHGDQYLFSFHWQPGTPAWR